MVEPTVLAADIGGTKCRFALVDKRERIHALPPVTTPTQQDEFLQLARRSLATLRDQRPADFAAPGAIGIGTAGVVQRDRRTLDYAPNLPLGKGFDLATELEGALGLPTTLINDGRASAVGEFKLGTLRGRDPLLVLFFGTGIGIGLVVDGQPYAGISNAAGEIGHTIHRLDGLPCPCGRRGCFEAYCGGKPIGLRAKQLLGPATGSSEWRLDAILARAKTDSGAEQILQEARAAACAMVANACTLLNPGGVVMGGGVLTAWPELYDSIEAFVRSWCTPIVTRDLRFARSRLGSDAILLGAAAATGKLW